MDRQHILYGEVIGPVREVPYKFTGESFDGAGPILPTCQPMRTLYVDHGPSALDPWPYEWDISSKPGSRIPRSRGMVAGGVPPTATKPIDPGVSQLTAPSGKGGFFGRLRPNR
jgi:hypothetical protein